MVRMLGRLWHLYPTNTLKKGTVTKLPSSVSSRNISQAIDARLEYGVEAGVEIFPRRLSMVGGYNLPLSIINATVQVPADGSRSAQPSPPATPAGRTEIRSVEYFRRAVRYFHANPVFRNNIHRSFPAAKFGNELGIGASIVADVELRRDSRTTELQHSIRSVSDARHSSELRSNLWPDIGSAADHFEMALKTEEQKKEN